jgi:L-iditol 2-dehydrogenase
MTMMKTAVLTSPGRFEIRDADKPRIMNPDDVLLKIALVGICGSDLHYFSSPRVGDVDLEYPIRLGHECAAVVEAAGPAVKKVGPGDRVSVEPAVSDGACDQCLAGRPNTCRKLEFIGTPGQLDGALAEYIIMPERNCYLLPKTMTMARGVLAEPLSIGLWSVDQAGDVGGRTIAILGAGPIGLSAALGARHKGARKIYMTEKIEARLAAARKAGADWGGNPLRMDIVAEIKRLEPLGMDIVFECCGQQEASDQAVDLLKPGGILVFVGIPVEERIAFEISKLRRKELRIQNVRRQNHCLGRAIDLIASGTLDADFMATHTFPLDRVGEAFDMAFNYRDGVIKALVSL